MVIIPTEKRFDWKHAPIVLFFIVLLNLLVFVFYQTGDTAKIAMGVQNYLGHNYLELEFETIQSYLRAEDELDAAAEFQQLYDAGNTPELAVRILIRPDIYPYLSQNTELFVSVEALGQWREVRADIHSTMMSLSSRRFGLTPADFSVVTLISHQFLHGGMMHIIGNLFFLIVCGFAVEAAIGHARFLAFYLISGAVGGLLHVAFNSGSHMPLVGASGAISGVMAMYLAVFRLLKIEFFYWFFVFVGYFRAPALAIFPIYLGKEIYLFMSDTGSNVAFMAHAGGFIAGVILILGSIVINPKILNTDYIEEDQDSSPQREHLNKIYQAIETFRFSNALQLVDDAIKTFGFDFELGSIRYNLTKIDGGENHHESVAMLCRLKRPSPGELSKIQALWQENPSTAKILDSDELIELGMQFTKDPYLKTAEQIFETLLEKSHKSSAMGVLAKKIALCHAEQRNPSKQAKYEKHAKAMGMGI